ncbi:MAG: branched-chain amino acid ABC transporter permease [Thermofilum sp. ex4484_15]|nr:MAG: branched-chain amino acid ABC transporter permease [Thermofilum sp. ex4484_15]
MISVEVLLDSLLFSNLITLMAIGLTLTYLTLKIPNFAHGDMATVGAYIVLTICRTYSLNPYLTFPLAFLGSGSLSLLSYLFVYRPLSRRRASIVVLMVASIALEIIIRSALHVYADIMSSLQRTYYRGLTYYVIKGFKEGTLKFGIYEIPLVTITSTLAVALITLFLYLFLTKTKFGIAMRAAIENPNLASTLGINVNKVYSTSWFIAGGLAGLSGAFLPFRIPTSPELGWELLLKTFAASTLGGLESVFGAIIGGYVTGFAEIMGISILSGPPFNLSTSYRPAIPLVVLIVTLLLVPRGLTSINFGRLIRRG